jgi:hypothetical protein
MEHTIPFFDRIKEGEFIVLYSAQTQQDTDDNKALCILRSDAKVFGCILTRVLNPCGAECDESSPRKLSLWYLRDCGD